MGPLDFGMQRQNEGGYVTALTHIDETGRAKMVDVGHKPVTAREATAEGYVTGLEPGTGFPATRRRERAAGRVPKLAPWETWHFALDVAIQADRAEVAAAAERVRAIQGERAVVLDGQTLG